MGSSQPMSVGLRITWATGSLAPRRVRPRSISPIVASNVGNTPASSPTKWQPIGTNPVTQGPGGGLGCAANPALLPLWTSSCDPPERAGGVHLGQLLVLCGPQVCGWDHVCGWELRDWDRQPGLHLLAGRERRERSDAVCEPGCLLAADRHDLGLRHELHQGQASHP